MTRGARRVLLFLRDRRFHTLAEIERECLVEGRSRLSELRAAGYGLERRRNPGGHGKASYSHRLVHTALGRALQDEEIEESSLAEPGRVPELDARPGSASVEMLATTPTPAEANGDSSAEGERIPPSAGPAVHEFTGALDARDGECGSAAAVQTSAAAAPAFQSSVEALPPPSREQLQLEEAS